MTPERWARVKTVFDQVCDLDTARRAALLHSACGDDAELRTEVESLLASSREAPAMLDVPAIQTFGDLPTARPDERRIGQRVGAYRLTDVVASGGMGTVYLAERADEQFEKRVAVKLIRHGMADEQSLRRFRNERQTLASLDHPNIARLLDGGVTSDGLPFLVMEYVEGLPIERYCDARRLSTVQRMRLFLTVCSAVQYAHQSLIVHRDIKPNNILVTGDGVPKLLDFGIAKVLDDEREPLEEGTVGEHRMLTPEYASPEQIRNEPITTATDVYSLGVVLYVLLTGHRPYRLRSRSLYEVQRAVCEQEPVYPSLAVSHTVEVTATDGTTRTITPEMVSATREGEPGRLRRRLVGDVDAIVMRAMHKDSRRRYPSAQQVADDIERYLSGLPVHARRGNVAYYTRKYIRRHAVSVLTAGAVAASLIGGIIGTSWQARVAADQRDLAIEARKRAQRETASALVETQKSERVITFLQKMLSAANPREFGPDARVRDVLDQASTHVLEEFGNDPEVESAIHATLGQTYIGLGEYDRAEPHLRRALEIQQEIHRGDHADVARGEARLGVLYYQRGQYEAALERTGRAVAMARRVYGEQHPEIATALNNLGVIQRNLGQLDEAGESLRAALAMRRSLYERDNPEIAETLNNLGNLLRTLGDMDEAAACVRESLDIRREALGEGIPIRFRHWGISRSCSRHRTSTTRPSR
jgi:serine/threonine-protein kinase